MNKQRFIQMIQRGIAFWNLELADKNTDDLSRYEVEKNNLFQLIDMVLQTEPIEESAIELIVNSFDFIRGIADEYRWFHVVSNAVSRTQDLQKKSELYRQLAGHLRVIGQYEAALNYYEKALEICKSIPSELNAHRIRIGMGQTLSVVGRVAEAKAMLQIALGEATKQEDIFAMAGARAMLSDVYFMQGNLPLAISHMRESADIWAELSESQNYIQALATIAELQLDAKDVPSCKKTLQEIEQKITLFTAVPSRCHHYVGMVYGACLVAENNIQKAKEVLHNTVEHWDDQTVNLENKARMFAVLAECYFADQSTEDAKSYYDLALTTLPENTWAVLRHRWIERRDFFEKKQQLPDN